MTPAEQLASLPEPIQEQLWTIVRNAAAMNEDEKANAMGALTGVSEAFLLFGGTSQPALLLLTSVGLLIGAVHNESQEVA